MGKQINSTIRESQKPQNAAYISEAIQRTDQKVRDYLYLRESVPLLVSRLPKEKVRKIKDIFAFFNGKKGKRFTKFVYAPVAP